MNNIERRRQDQRLRQQRVEAEAKRLNLTVEQTGKLLGFETFYGSMGYVPIQCEDWIAVLESFAVPSDPEAEQLPEMVPLWELDGYDSLEQATDADLAGCASMRDRMVAALAVSAPAAWAVIFEGSGTWALLGGE